ncbi:MAG: hypothetical protein ACPIOQ_78615, partial [Promethearchaeia archaeon]
MSKKTCECKTRHFFPLPRACRAYNGIRGAYHLGVACSAAQAQGRRGARQGERGSGSLAKKQHELFQFRYNRYTPHKIQLDSQHCTRLPRDYLAERSSTGMRLRGGEACRRRCAPFAPPLVKHLSPVGQPRQVNAAGMGRVHDELWGGARKGRGLA